MSKPKEPVELIIAKGNKHLTKAEITNRQASEIKASADNIQAPRHLSKAQRDMFDNYAGQLQALGIMSNLDVDTLAIYIQSYDNYKKYHALVRKALAVTKDIATMETMADLLNKYENLRDKAVKQCRTCAGDLGLNISSRCRLVIPQAPAPPPKNKFVEKFGT